MPRKPAQKPDDPEEYKRFLETAKEADAEDDPKAFDKAFKKVATRSTRRAGAKGAS